MRTAEVRAPSSSREAESWLPLPSAKLSASFHGAESKICIILPSDETATLFHSLSKETYFLDKGRLQRFLPSFM